VSDSLPIPAAARSSIGFGQRGLQLMTFEDMFRFSKCVVASGLAPKSYRTPEQVLVAIETGAEVGFGPMQSLTAFTVLNGVPRIMVEPALALVLASGQLAQRHERWEGEGLERCAVVALVRKGGLAVERRFSIADAKNAGLESKDNWRGYPDRMLYARALGYALHDLFADVLRGMRIAETMDDSASLEIVPGVPLSRSATYGGPDPLVAQIEAGSQAIEIELQAEPELVPVSQEVSHAD
jgi:hypothetical protein